MIINIVNRQADNFCIQGRPFICQHRNSSEFSGADRCEIFGVREQDSPALVNPVMKPDRAFISIGTEIRNNVVNTNSHSNLLLPFK